MTSKPVLQKMALKEYYTQKRKVHVTMKIWEKKISPDKYISKKRKRKDSNTMKATNGRNCYILFNINIEL
jgi:hypothetical protein